MVIFGNLKNNRNSRPQQTKGGSDICSLDNLRSISRTLFGYGNIVWYEAVGRRFESYLVY